MLTPNEIAQIVTEVGHELRAVEFKCSGAVSEKRYVAKVARAVLGMANLRDGGNVLLGVAEKSDGTPELVGLDVEHVEGWSNYDRIADALAVYTDPPVSFESRIVEMPDGVKLAVLQVDAFTDVPHLCAKSYNDGTSEILRQGALYVRKSGKPATSEIASHAEMREILEIATQHSLRRFITTAHRAGVSLSEPTSEDPFGKEADPKLWIDMGSRAYWDVAIRPLPYDPRRISRDALKSVIMQSAVRLRGWPLPYMDQKLQNWQNAVGCDVVSRNSLHEEQWRFFTSGQFLHRRILLADTEGQSDVVRVWEILFPLTEAVELAGRLATAMVTPKTIAIEARLHGVAGRKLVSDVPSRRLFDDYHTQDNDLTSTLEVTVVKLVSDARQLGVTMAKEIFHGFGFAPSDTVLSEYQHQNLR
ncbi:AlbA family DNA-binding domain-containing protein [Nocardia gipuzkoensis]